MLQKKIDTMQKRQTELTKLFKRLYEDSLAVSQMSSTASSLRSTPPSRKKFRSSFLLWKHDFRN